MNLIQEGKSKEGKQNLEKAEKLLLGINEKGGMNS
jgi:hypothetical protein